VAVQPEKVMASTYGQVAAVVEEEACTPARDDCPAWAVWDLEVECDVDLTSSLDTSAVFRPDPEHWTRRIVIRT
jgi:hypothetical protein